MSGPSTPIKPTSGESSSSGSAPKPPENSQEGYTVPSTLDPFVQAFNKAYAVPEPTAHTLSDRTPPALPTFRTSVLKEITLPLASEMVFHGSGPFLCSDFHELQAAKEYHEARSQHQPISGRQKAVHALTCGRDHELTSDDVTSTYETRVSFDTFDNKNATDISFTLVCKHKDYKYSRRSRYVLPATLNERTWARSLVSRLVSRLLAPKPYKDFLCVLTRDYL